MIPRGVRNNNPGNIKELPGDTTQWQGERATDDDSIFEEFETPEAGFRAFGKILRNYQSKYGLDTVRKCITRWAPTSENDTDNYINFVCANMNIGADETIDLTNDELLVSMLQAMTRMEQGRAQGGSDWWDVSVIRAGVKMI